MVAAAVARSRSSKAGAGTMGHTPSVVETAIQVTWGRRTLAEAMVLLVAVLVMTACSVAAMVAHQDEAQRTMVMMIGLNQSGQQGVRWAEAMALKMKQTEATEEEAEGTMMLIEDLVVVLEIGAMVAVAVAVAMAVVVTGVTREWRQGMVAGEGVVERGVVL